MTNICFLTSQLFLLFKRKSFELIRKLVHSFCLISLFWQELFTEITPFATNPKGMVWFSLTFCCKSAELIIGAFLYSLLHGAKWRGAYANVLRCVMCNYNLFYVYWHLSMISSNDVCFIIIQHSGVAIQARSFCCYYRQPVLCPTSRILIKMECCNKEHSYLGCGWYIRWHVKEWQLLC